MSGEWETVFYTHSGIAKEEWIGVRDSVDDFINKRKGIPLSEALDYCITNTSSVSRSATRSADYLFSSILDTTCLKYFVTFFLNKNQLFIGVYLSVNSFIEKNVTPPATFFFTDICLWRMLTPVNGRVKILHFNAAMGVAEILIFSLLGPAAEVNHFANVLPSSR